MENKVKMSVEMRAKQFMPFSALQGFESLIEEVGKEEEKRVFQDCDENNIKPWLWDKKSGYSNPLMPDSEQMDKIKFSDELKKLP